MVTPQEMRLFALDCLRLVGETANAHRDLMLRIAKTWMNNRCEHRATYQRWLRVGDS